MGKRIEPGTVLGKEENQDALKRTEISGHRRPANRPPRREQSPEAAPRPIARDVARWPLCDEVTVEGGLRLSGH